MKSAVLSGPGTLTFEERPLPPLEPESVRVRLEGCGVCGSSLPVWEGRSWFRYPLEAGAPGHEGWGYIEAVGPAVRRLHPGERVALLSYHAFAEYDVTHQDNVVVLPATLKGQPFVINTHERAPEVYLRGMRAAVEAVASGELDPTPLYTHRFKLKRLPQAFESLRERPERFLKSLVTYD